MSTAATPKSSNSTRLSEDLVSGLSTDAICAVFTSTAPSNRDFRRYCHPRLVKSISPPATVSRTPVARIVAPGGRAGSQPPATPKERSAVAPISSRERAALPALSGPGPKHATEIESRPMGLDTASPIIRLTISASNCRPVTTPRRKSEERGVFMTFQYSAFRVGSLKKTRAICNRLCIMCML